MTKAAFSSILFLIIIGLGCVMAGICLPRTLAENPPGSADDLLKGRWGVAFEKSLGEILPLFTPSRNFWSQADYRFFHQGRKGVVVGKQGWLFSDEEFSCPRDAAANLTGNLDFISRTQAVLAQKNVKLVIALVPAKIRVNAEYAENRVLPPCRTDLYRTTLMAFKSHHIEAVDLLTPMLQSPEKKSYYLRTDTHWTPAGAAFSASIIAGAATPLSGDKKDFITTFGKTAPHEGDLLRYLPGVRNRTVRGDKLVAAETDASGEADLFGDASPPVTLVGTSYSANPLWNFEGFLKQSLHSDVLNMADPGLGPFTVMDKYLAGDSWQSAPPQILIWEIPERYLVFPHTIHHS